jgi:hypothetical protein
MVTLLYLQTDWMRVEDSHVSCFTYDSTRRRLVTAVNKPYVWQHKVRTAAPLRNQPVGPGHGPRSSLAIKLRDGLHIEFAYAGSCLPVC